MSASDPRDAKIAALLADRYDLVNHLGRGGFATVYRVRNRRLNRVEALKVLSADLEEPDFVARFRQEARLAASLDHPHIIKIFDFGQGDDLCWFTMQLVEGPTLIRELKQKGPWSEADTSRLATAVLDALEYSHRRGIIHRDIKPENILVDAERHPFLMDFGIAKSDQSVVHTRTGTILGSPAYIAPEQLTGTGVDGRADIYSLGATLYRMVSNSLPFQDSDPVRMAMKRFTMPPEPLGPKRPGINPVFEAIVMRSLERDPALRFSSAAEMASALRAFLAGQPVSLPPLSWAASPGGEEAGTPRAFSAPFPSAAVAPATGPGADAIPTIRTPLPGASAQSPGPHSAVAGRRHPLVWFAGAAIVAAAAALVYVVTSPTSPVGSPTGAPVTPASAVSGKPPTAGAEHAAHADRPSPDVAAVTSLGAAIPTPAPAPAPGATPVSLLSEGRTPEPTVPAHASARRSAPDGLSRSRQPVSAEERAPAASVRRAVVPAQTESEAPIELASDLAREFGNRSVGLAVVVSEDGSVREARVISPLCPECDRAARAAILRYRFKPARDAQGRPVESRVAVPVIIPSPE